MKKKEKRERKPKAYYVKLASMMDLARELCSFGARPRYMHAIREGKEYRLFSIGEKIDNTRILYYHNNDRIASFWVYNPGTDTQKEEFEMMEQLGETQDFKLYKAPIIEIASNPYTIKEKLVSKNQITHVLVRDYRALVKSLIITKPEEMTKVYAFNHGAKRVLGTFELFKESGSKVFAYSELDTKDIFSFLSYNYTNDTLRHVNSIGDKQYIHVKVINLASAFPFFKPE